MGLQLLTARVQVHLTFQLLPHGCFQVRPSVGESQPLARVVKLLYVTDQQTLVLQPMQASKVTFNFTLRLQIAQSRFYVMYSYIHACIHTYIHTYIHTHVCYPH